MGGGGAEGEGREGRAREGGAGMGGTVKPTGRIHRKIPERGKDKGCWAAPTVLRAHTPRVARPVQTGSPTSASQPAPLA